MSRFFFLLGQGVKNIFTHGFMSFASVAVITVCLFIMGCFSLITLNIDNMIAEMQSQNRVIAYVNEDFSEEQARAIESDLQKLDNIESLEFVTREEALEAFESDYNDSLFEDIDSSVLRDRFVLSLTDLSLMKETKTELEQVDGIVKVTAHLEYAEKFVTLRNIVSIVSVILVVTLIVVSLFIMTNTIKLATFTRREEIAIMRMVGATNGFIRLPFVVEGLVLGALGGAIAYGLVALVYHLATEKLLAAMAFGFVVLVPFSTVALPLLGVFLGVGILVGVLGGVSAIRNYLKV
ncbi:MAG: permease-like cell division protein FtsX [Oscillospiraceae bacterium]|nr:permease-like cell division protein FtsX [Oscillospiraceae bacterium]MBQ6404274.1 permease-like cell division protein FtsX [Oscillospiraceae bacterium]